MSNIYLLTIPRGENVTEFEKGDALNVSNLKWRVGKKMLKIMLENNDCKRWIIGKETGGKGYEHWQIRVETSNKAFFDWVHELIPCAHVEQSTAEWSYRYERKEGAYWKDNDTNEVRAMRFGKPRAWQKGALQTLRTQNDRQVDVWYDPKGERGKSWLVGHLFETGKAFVVPRSYKTIDDIASYICKHYRNEGTILIDIPRGAAIPKGFYLLCEMIKDGLIGTTKYEGDMIDIRGVKLAVFTNHKLDYEELSKDRWRLHGIKEEESAGSLYRNTNSAPLFPPLTGGGNSPPEEVKCLSANAGQARLVDTARDDPCFSANDVASGFRRRCAYC